MIKQIPIYEMMRYSEEIRNLMIDDESKKLYDARMKYLIDRDFYDYSFTVLDEERVWKISQIDRAFENDNSINRIVVFGCGSEGKYVRKLLYRSKYSDITTCYCDNNTKLWNTDIKTSVNNDVVSTVVISPHMINKNKDVVIVASSQYCKQIFEQLINLLFPIKRIVYPQGIYGHHLYGVTGFQYFDFFKPKKNEVFIDCGCLNGNTSLEFVKWCNNDYKSIVAFEPNQEMIDSCKSMFSRELFHDVELVTKGVWSSEDKLSFFVTEGVFMGGSRIKESGNRVIETTSIDNVLNGKEATFIKMDIEGSEYEGLIGAEKTIKSFSPRLALSIYHKPEDIIEIPYIVHKYNPQYRFAIRQYASNMQETVLYAWVE